MTTTTIVYPIARTVTTAWSANARYVVVCPECGAEHNHTIIPGKKKAPCGATYIVDTDVAVPFRLAPKKVDPEVQARYDELMAAQRDREHLERWEAWLGQ